MNTIRVTSEIYPISYLKNQSRRTLIYSTLLMLVWLSLSAWVEIWQLDSLILVLSGFAFMLSAIIFLKITNYLFNGSKSKHIKNNKTHPTVTVAIPARNEDATLEKTLHMLLDSNYPKLEILVIDDCSYDKTAQIIKSFAHRGVRFLHGDTTKDNWLGKNYAYQQLLEAASGELILFCGVDIRFPKHAISELVDEYLNSNLHMLAVLPIYEPEATNQSVWDVSQQITRYFWQLGLSEIFEPNPPTVGSCWLIDKQKLLNLGGFESIKQQIEPEKYLAQQIAGEGNYKFLASSSMREKVVSTKRSNEQIDHILRVSYPTLKRSISNTILFAFILLMLMLAPIYGFLNILFTPELINLSWLLLTGCGFLLLTSYSLIYLFSAPKYILSAPVMYLVAIVEFIAIVFWSMVNYELLGIEWKGRNVCITPLNLEMKRLPKRKKFRAWKHRN